MSIRPVIDKELEVVKQFELAVRSLLEYFSGTGENYRMALDYIDQYTAFSRFASNNKIERNGKKTAAEYIHSGYVTQTRYNNTEDASKVNPTGSTIDHYRFNGVDYPVDWDNVEADSYKEFGR